MLLQVKSSPNKYSFDPGLIRCKKKTNLKVRNIYPRDGKKKKKNAKAMPLIKVYRIF